MSSSANSKKSASPDLPCLNFSVIDASYAALFLMSWSKIVGFEVSPVTENSSMYRLSVPLVRRSRVMLSSQRLWPKSCSFCVGFMLSDLRTQRTNTADGHTSAKPLEFIYVRSGKRVRGPKGG